LNHLTGPLPAQALREPLVEIIPIGPVDETACAVIAAHLEALMGLPARIRLPWPLPAKALLPARRQYDAGPILKDMALDLSLFQVRLGVTVLDLCLPILSYVYGEAFLGGRLAVISLCRLGRLSDGRTAEKALLYERLAKVAMHEVSHALGVPHCREAGCLMRFSQGLKNLDELSLRFCPGCRQKVEHFRAGLIKKIDPSPF
jgi:archaemetzincin